MNWRTGKKDSYGYGPRGFFKVLKLFIQRHNRASRRDSMTPTCVLTKPHFVVMHEEPLREAIIERLHMYLPIWDLNSAEIVRRACIGEIILLAGYSVSGNVAIIRSFRLSPILAVPIPSEFSNYCFPA